MRSNAQPSTPRVWRAPIVIAAVALLVGACTSNAAQHDTSTGTQSAGTPSTAQASPTPPATPVPGTAASPTDLHVSGNQFVNGQGQPVRLRGFNFSGAEYACIEGWGIFDAPDSTTISASVIAAMAGWTGANAVRVPLNEQCWLGLGVAAGYGGTAYQNAIKQLVQLLTSHGFATVLDLDRTAPGKAKSLNNEALPDRDHSLTFWRQVATTFKGNGSVAFDLFNEPAPYGESASARAWQCWRDGGCVLKSENGGGNYVAAGMNELIDAIRQTGSRNVVLAGGIYWAEQMDQWLAYEPTDPLHNLAASFHGYSFNQLCASLSCYNSVLASVAAKVPLYVGEVGPDLTIGYDQVEQRCPASAVGQTGWDKTIFDWMSQHGASYAVWSWNKWPSCWALVTDWTGAPTGIWGNFVKSRLATMT